METAASGQIQESKQRSLFVLTGEQNWSVMLYSALVYTSVYLCILVCALVYTSVH